MSELGKGAPASRRWALVATSFVLLGLLGIAGWWALATFRQGPRAPVVSRLGKPGAQDRAVETVNQTPGVPQAPGPSAAPPARPRRVQRNAGKAPPAAAPVAGAPDASKAPAEPLEPAGPLEMVPSGIPGGGYTIDLKGRYQVETRITGGAPQ